MDSGEKKPVFLVHWTYSRDEWVSFQRWNSKRQGLLNYFYFEIFKSRSRRIPEVAITEHKVWIGDSVHSFRDGNNHLKRIHIREAANMNIIEIRFEKKAGKQVANDDICVPVPKGKLREAMAVHESLSEHAW